MTPQNSHSSVEPKHMTYRSLRSLSTRFCTVHPFAQPPKSYVLQCFSIGQTPSKLPLTYGDLNPISYMLPCVHPSPHPKRHLDRFSCFCTAHGIESLYFTMGRPFPSKLPLRGYGPHLIHGSLTPSEYASRSVQRLLQRSRS